MEPKWAAKHIADLIRESKKTVVFTGAGMSTESGLPDFRSSGGLWDGKDPMQISHVRMLKENPSMVTNFYRTRIQEAKDHSPNRGHYILAEWETQGKIWGIATQNIDGYHTRAGSNNVCELHGNLNARCWHCEAQFDGEIYLRLTNHEDLTCKESVEWQDEPCGGLIRPNVVMFGEDLPQRTFARALQHFSQADLCIILGSSCSVYPANSLPQYTVTNGGQVVIINKTETDLDFLSSYKITEWSISKSLEEINKNLQD